ncbi:MAG: META domain-containing protein [Hyphomonas sp.]|nr:META domain-containing protein [Hyphomonas sp.]
MRRRSLRRTCLVPLLSFGALMATSACCLNPGHAAPSEGAALTETAPARVKLAGTSWTVEGLGGAAVVSGHEPGITFTGDGQINGTTGCNRFFGSYVQDGDRVTFSGLGMTKMACMGDGIMGQEIAFAGMLSGEAAASIDGLGRLTITGAKGVGFVAVPMMTGDEAGDPALLLGAEWIVEDINRTGIIDNSRLTLAFGADGRVSGSTNCNAFSGTYSVDGSKLALSPLVMTRRACAAPALAFQETKYVGALSGELGWRFAADGALVITGDEDSRVQLRR